MGRTLLCGLLLFAVVAPLAADGPETGVVTGTVTEPGGTALPGIDVKLIGERGEKLTQTADDGTFRFALLVPGTYLVKVEIEGLGSAEQTVAVTAGERSDVALALKLETAETITVASEAPVVDKYNVTAGATITSEVGAQAAGGTRTYYGLLNMLPGVTSDADNGNLAGMRPSVNGSHFADQAVYVDGVDTTFARFGGSRVILPTVATTEVTMEAGGAGAEYGRAVGSSSNVIVRSGTNQFHGEALGLYADQSWNGEYKDQPVLEGLEFGPAPRDYLKRSDEEKDATSDSFEASLGGPILKDKAWFFAAWNDSTTAQFSKTFNGDVIDTSIEYGSTIGKINFQPSARHQLAATYIDTPIRVLYASDRSGDKWNPTDHDLSGELVTGSWSWSISQTLFLETKLATQTSNENKYLATGDTDVAAAIRTKQMDSRFPGDPALAQVCQFSPRADPRCDTPGNNYAVYADTEDYGSWHNGWVLDNGFGINKYPRDQANAALSWFAGDDHEVKFGIDWQEVKWLQDVRRQTFYSGPNFSATSPTGYSTPCGIINGGSPGGHYCFMEEYNPADLVARGRGNSESSNENLTLYGRDRFTAGDHWTFTAGLRLSAQENLNDVGHKVVDTQTVEPRLAATYDVKGDSTMLFSLNAGRYYAQLNQQFTNEWLMEEWNGWNAYDDFLYCDGLDVFVNTVLAPGAISGCNSVGYNFPYRSFRPGEQFQLAEQGLLPEVDLDPYYKDEIIVGFEWQVSQNWAFDAKALYWELGDMIMNTAQRGPGNDSFFMSVNDDDFTRNLRALGVVPEDTIDAFEGPFKEYTALQLQLNRRFGNGWAVYNNLTLSKLETTGSGAWWNNTSSTYGEDLGTVLNAGMIANCQAEQATRSIPMDCHAALDRFLGQPVSTINRDGRDGIGGGIGAGDGGFGAGVDRPYIWKTFGFKEFAFGKQTLNVGGLLTVQDGPAWGRGENVGAPTPDDPLANVFLPLEKNGERRLDGVYELNLTVAWTFPIHADRVRGNLRVESTNVTNQQDQISVNLLGEAARVRGYFQQPTTYRSMFSVSF